MNVTMKGLIDWSVGVAVGRGTIVITIVCTWREGVQNRGRSSFCWFISVDQTSLSKQQHAAYLERRKPERQSFNHRASLKLSAYGRSQSINRQSIFTQHEESDCWEGGVCCCLLRDDVLGPCYTIDCLLREMCKGKQQSLSQCTQCNAHCLF